MAAQMISVSVVGTGKPVTDKAFTDLARAVERSIGILSGKKDPEEPTFDEKRRISIEPKKQYPNAFIENPIYTHLPGKNPIDPTSRNYLNARTGATMIALHGDTSKESEVEIALALGKPVIALLGEGQHIESRRGDSVGPYRSHTRESASLRTPRSGTPPPSCTVAVAGSKSPSDNSPSSVTVA